LEEAFDEVDVEGGPERRKVARDMVESSSESELGFDLESSDSDQDIQQNIEEALVFLEKEKKSKGRKGYKS
jgi:hypothetical protein